MNRLKFSFTVLQVIALSLTISCSNSEKPDEKNVIEKTTNKIALDAVETINKPINKAKNIELLSTDHTREIEAAAKQE